MGTVVLLSSSTDSSYDRSLVSGLLDRLRGSGHRLVCLAGGAVRSQIGFEEERNFLYELIDEGSSDAVVVSGVLSHNLSADAFEAFCRRFANRPLVTVAVELPGLASVTITAQEGLAGVLDHLIEAHGVRTPLFLGGPPGQKEAEDRRAAFDAALARAGLTPDPAGYWGRDYTRASGRAAAEALASGAWGSRRPDAVVAVNDTTALGFLETWQRLGQTPIPVTGFDDAEDGRWGPQALTTVRQDVAALGRAAADQVVACLAGQGPPASVRVASEPVLRRSCGCPPPPPGPGLAQDLEAVAAEGVEARSVVERSLAVGECLQATATWPELLETLGEVLVTLGYQGFWLSILEDPARPRGRARLHLSGGPGGWIADPEGIAFDAPDLVPGRHFPPEADPGFFLVEALHSRNHRLGFLVLASDLAHSRLTGVLRNQVSAAIQAVRALEERERTEKRLVLAARTEALGALVAGLAHEINTPLGVAVTAASFLMEQLGDQASPEVLGTGRALEANLQRAAELVNSFKRLAADAAGELRRRFDLGEYMGLVVESLRPRAEGLVWMVDLPRGWIADSYPVAVAQVVTSLLENALVHAWPGSDRGRLTVTLGAEGLQARLVVDDDGVGVDPSVRGRLFEPFFTTGRHRGCLGLGLPIAWNAVRGVLGGTLELVDKDGPGARFVLTFPLQAPRQTSDA